MARLANTHMLEARARALPGGKQNINFYKAKVSPPPSSHTFEQIEARPEGHEADRLLERQDRVGACLETHI